jgi:hypothetical protein
VRDVRALDRKIASLDQRIREEVEASGTTLTEIFGVGSILAAKIVFDRRRRREVPEQGALRLLRAGVAPIEASSGEVVRHRVSLAGNRRLNQVMHMIAVCQARSDPRGKAYYRKKLAEGKSRSLRRCGASSGASPMRCSRRSLLTQRVLLSQLLDTEGPRVYQRVEKVDVGPVGGPKEARNKAKILQKRRFLPLNRGQKRARRSFSTRCYVLGS